MDSDVSDLPLVRLLGLLPIELGAGAVLRLTDLADAEPAFAVVDRERDRLREWLPWVDATTSVDVEREFLASVHAAAAAGTMAGLTLEVDGSLAGLVGLRTDLTHDSVEVGYWLSETAVGRGLMTRAVGALATLCLSELGLHRFVLKAATGNRRSRAIAQRLGMVHEGTLREAERLAAGFTDLESYSLLATDPPPVTGAPGAAE